MPTPASSTPTSAQDYRLYDLGCATCGAGRGTKCTTSGGTEIARWHEARSESAERHYRYGHQHGSFCECGIGP